MDMPTGLDVAAAILKSDSEWFLMVIDVAFEVSKSSLVPKMLYVLAPTLEVQTTFELSELFKSRMAPEFSAEILSICFLPFGKDISASANSSGESSSAEAKPPNIKRYLEKFLPGNFRSFPGSTTSPFPAGLEKANFTPPSFRVPRGRFGISRFFAGALFMYIGDPSGSSNDTFMFQVRVLPSLRGLNLREYVVPPNMRLSCTSRFKSPSNTTFPYAHSTSTLFALNTFWIFNDSSGFMAMLSNLSLDSLIGKLNA